MDQFTELNPHERRATTDRIADFVVQSVDAARASDRPFFHLELDRVFPDDVYASMLGFMPEYSDYRPMHGRSRGNDLADGTHTRVKIDLFPEYIRHLPEEKLPVWDVVGRALCSEPNINIGTIFHEVLPDRSLPKSAQMRFAPNTGYAFAVGTDTWHSADLVGPEVTTRDSILLTYFVDSGLLQFVRNRSKRIGNFVLNEVRRYTR